MHAPTPLAITTRLTPHIPLFPTSQILSREPKLRTPSRITKDHKLRLKEDIPKDRQTDARITLQAPEAAPTPRRGSIIHITPRHNSLVAFDSQSKVWQIGGAREDVTAVGLAVGGPGDLGVIGRDEVVGQEEEGGSRVGDGGEAVADRGSGADRVPARCEGPEALGVVHGRVGDVARVLARVDVAEVVASGGTLFQVCGEEWGVEAGLGVGEEGLCLVGLDGVDGAEGEAEKTVALVLSEFRADFLSQFDGLAGHSRTTNIDDIGVDVAAG